MEIKVVNLKSYPLSPPYLLIKVGRPSPLGNPFIMHTEADRDKVCDLYEQWVRQQIAEKNSAVCNELNRIYKLAKTHPIALGCFCAPKRCHAETIRQLLLEAEAKTLNKINNIK